MTVGSREDLFANAKPIDDTERLIGRVLAGESHFLFVSQNRKTNHKSGQWPR